MTENSKPRVFPAHFFAGKELAVNHPLPGITMELGWGEKMMLSRVTLEPHSSIPEHSHPHEQAGVCIEGRFELTIDGETQILGPGDIYLIPGDIPHSVRCLDQVAKTVDIFTPIREDYLPQEDA